jgi:hypothetical protein
VTPEAWAALGNMALVPITALLWRISTQLAALNERIGAHADRLDKIERHHELESMKGSGAANG